MVYDSVYGNTQKIAEAVGGALAGETKVVRVNEVDPARLGQIDLLIVGSPTLGGRPSEPMQDFLVRIPGTAVKGLKFATFDTRYSGKFVRVFGFAAEKIGENLVSKGGVQSSPPEPFYVKGKKGPLKEGELERAANWARGLSR